jgi:hypothetical protein
MLNAFIAWLHVYRVARHSITHKVANVTLQTRYLRLPKMTLDGALDGSEAARYFESSQKSSQTFQDQTFQDQTFQEQYAPNRTTPTQQWLIVVDCECKQKRQYNGKSAEEDVQEEARWQQKLRRPKPQLKLQPRL